MSSKTTQPAGSPAGTVTLPGGPGKSKERRMAEAVTEGTLSNALTARVFAHGTFGELHAAECVDALRASVQAVQAGDLSGAEAMLTAQATALNAIFGEMARRSALNVGQHLDAAERYMRLALKAQGQCRATLETLATIKNPPVVFARQANIAHGPQQVNNAVVAGSGGARNSHVGARAANRRTEQSRLLEAGDGQQVDTGAASAAGGADSDLETVAARHRATHA